MHHWPLSAFYYLVAILQLLLQIQYCNCQTMLPLNGTNETYVYLNQEKDLAFLIMCEANTETRIETDELPELSSVHPVERTLRGLAYIPLSEQKLHSKFDTTGFNSLLDMITYEPKSSHTYTALPNLKLTDEPGNEKYMAVDVNITPDIALVTWLNTTCKHQDLLKYRLNHRLGFKCRVGYDNRTYFSNSTLLDALGFWALKVFKQSWQDVFMKVPNWNYNFVAPSTEWYIDSVAINYNVEIKHPRSLWPAWVNLYLFLRKSYHDCTDIMDRSKCINIFTDIHQLSLTYAYFVCRITNGEAGDRLCPEVCKADPCKHIANAVEGTCYPIGLRIHWYDYFCFCEPGYVWTSPTSRVNLGKCVKDTRETDNSLGDCTLIEKSTFCNPLGTHSCYINRNDATHNRKPACTCKYTFAGEDCGYEIKDGCQQKGYRGRLQCRENEIINGTSNGKCISLPGDFAYKCFCNSKNYLRWTDQLSTYESCMPFRPNSFWLQRAQSCGYDDKLTDGDYLWKFCNTNGCNSITIRGKLEQLEISACGGKRGKCDPPLNSLNEEENTVSRCSCDAKYSGAKCTQELTLFPHWTPWSICYPTNFAKSGSERFRYRFQKCDSLQRYDNGSVPKCVNGETENKICPDLAQDLEDVITPEDYGVASQAVISMWRIVELMLLLDFLFVIVLIILLLHHKRALDSDSKKQKDTLSKPADSGQALNQKLMEQIQQQVDQAGQKKESLDKKEQKLE